MSRLLRFFPPVVTGTIITIIGISLMRVGIGWAMGGPAPLAQSVDVPRLVAMVDAAKACRPRPWRRVPPPHQRR
jgi:xanthine/uracil permease